MSSKAIFRFCLLAGLAELANAGSSHVILAQSFGGVLAGTVTWQQFRENRVLPITATVPTAANRVGDFTATLNRNIVLGTNPCDGQPIYQGEIFDPATTRNAAAPGGGTVQCRLPFAANGALNVVRQTAFHRSRAS